MKIRYSYVESVATQVLRASGLAGRLPVPVRDILRKRGVVVKEKDLEEAVLGFSLIEDGIQAVAIRKQDSKSRKRFTMAHELGHLVLHLDQNVNINRGGLMYRRQESTTSETTWREAEANHFGACLLMPKDRVFDELKEISPSGVVREETIKEMAKRFEVSEAAMTVRLTVLGLAG